VVEHIRPLGVFSPPYRLLWFFRPLAHQNRPQVGDSALFEKHWSTSFNRIDEDASGFCRDKSCFWVLQKIFIDIVEVCLQSMLFGSRQSKCTINQLNTTFSKYFLSAAREGAMFEVNLCTLYALSIRAFFHAQSEHVFQKSRWNISQRF